MFCGSVGYVRTKPTIFSRVLPVPELLVRTYDVHTHTRIRTRNFCESWNSTRGTGYALLLEPECGYGYGYGYSIPRAAFAYIPTSTRTRDLCDFCKIPIPYPELL